jgi:hypothetical protein
MHHLRPPKIALNQAGKGDQSFLKTIQEVTHHDTGLQRLAMSMYSYVQQSKGQAANAAWPFSHFSCQETAKLGKFSHLVKPANHNRPNTD